MFFFSIQLSLFSNHPLKNLISTTDINQLLCIGARAPSVHDFREGPVVGGLAGELFLRQVIQLVPAAPIAPSVPRIEIKM